MSAATLVPEGSGLADPEIEVLVSNGDRAFALDPDGAVAAAREMLADARRAASHQGSARAARGLSVSFLTNGLHVRTVEGRLL